MTLKRGVRGAAAPRFSLRGLAGEQDLVGEMVVHPVEVVPARGDDPLCVPGGHRLLGGDLHEAGVDLVDVLEAHDDGVVDALRFRGLLIAQAPDAHS